jgi:glycosyltransferase involved in cell wall biosynthesis
MSRILQLRSEFRDNGPGTQSLTIAVELRRRGHFVMFCSSGGLLSDHLREHGFELEIIPTLAVTRRDPISTMRNVLALAKVIRKHRIDVVHAHNAAAAYCAYVAQFFALRRIGVVHSVRGIELRPTHRWRNYIYRFYPPQILAVSEFTKRELLKYGARAAKIQVSYNGVDTDKFYFADRFAEGADPGSRDLVIASVGAFDGWKGQAVLVRALPELLKLNDKVRIVFVGDGPTRGAVEKLAMELGVSGRVTFLGFRTDIPNILADVDIYALPSTQGEMLPNSILEAMSMGKPWVGSDISGLSEMSADGKAGLMCQPSSVESLVAQLGRLITDANLRQRMGHAARAEILRKFSVSKVVDTVVKAYQRTGRFRDAGI